VSYPSGCYNRAPNLRIRPLKEMKSCVVFRPDPPKLFMLNLNAWLILELCDGCPADQVLQRYIENVGASDAEADAGVVLEAGLRQLQEQQLIFLKQQTIGETGNEQSIVPPCL
jgi:hypothetical protein